MNDIEKTLMVLNAMTYKLLFNHPKYHWGYDAVRQKFSASYDEFIGGQKSVVPGDMKEDIITFGLVKKPEGLEIKKADVGGVAKIEFGINLNELDVAAVDKKSQEYLAAGVFETPNEDVKMSFDGITRGILRPSVTDGVWKLKEKEGNIFLAMRFKLPEGQTLPDEFIKSIKAAGLDGDLYEISSKAYGKLAVFDLEVRGVDKAAQPETKLKAAFEDLSAGLEKVLPQPIPNFPK